MQKKKLRTSFFFIENIMRIGGIKFSLLRREYLSSAINVLTNTYKVLHITKTDFSQLSYLQNYH